jgi:hypothetical protein
VIGLFSLFLGRAKQAEADLANAQSQATTNYESLQECKKHVSRKMHI